ncbi:MFS transporter [Alicyclobacillus tolerans]|uniref:EmrB/QacA subfamily drug resistance transporter n=1 Tax=Alicyclobacillus tolerans TaxID=90970 RepID=A0ABT9LSD4_9BACL|nr:MFS transporter [Alicyclobacillus tengchongensis]MDP9727171.1 EmrB/QacA subfamily drug resistance transporter [Alicyclobacillus tengchongensis]
MNETSIWKNKWFILANVCVGTFMATLDGSIANVALPTMSHALHVHLQEIQWVVTAYLLTICAWLPIVGKLADMFGRGRLYNFGFLVFAMGSALCALSGSYVWLILSRILQAFGASLLMANSQAIVSATFPGSERGRALGVTGAMVSVGSLTGPALGGILIAAFGWSSIFWINVPIGVLGFLVGTQTFRRQTKRQLETNYFDWAGSMLFMIAIISLLYTVSNADTWGWGSELTLLGFFISIVAWVLFVWRQLRASQPVVDLRLYKINAFRAGSIAALLSFVSLFCTNVLMPFYLEGVLHLDTRVTGYTMAAYPLTMALVAPFSGWLSDRIGPLFLTTGGLCVNALGFALLNTLGLYERVISVALLLAMFGLGQGMFQSPNNSSVMGAVPRERLGTAGGLNALVRNIGMILGITLSVSLLSWRLHQMTGKIVPVGAQISQPMDFLAALHTVFWSASAVCVLGALFSITRAGARNQKLSSAEAR